MIRLRVAVVGKATRTELTMPTDDLILLYNLARSFTTMLSVLMQLAEQSLDMDDDTMEAASRVFDHTEDVFASVGLRVLEGEAVDQGEGGQP